MIKWPRPLFSLVGCPLGRSDPSLRHYKQWKSWRPVKILQTGMARTPPPPQACSSPECTYVTPTGVPTRDLVTTYLTNHTNTCHAPTACETPPQPSSKYGETTQTYLCTGYARGSLGIQDSSVEGLHRASGSLRQSKVTAATGSLHTRPTENLRRWVLRHIDLHHTVDEQDGEDRCGDGPQGSAHNEYVEYDSSEWLEHSRFCYEHNWHCRFVWDDPRVHQLPGRELVQGPGRPAGDVTRHARQWQCDQIQIDVQEHHLSSLHKTVHFIEAEEAGSKKHLTCMNILKLIPSLDQQKDKVHKHVWHFSQGSFVIENIVPVFLFLNFSGQILVKMCRLAWRGPRVRNFTLLKSTYRSRQDAKGRLLARFFLLFCA